MTNRHAQHREPRADRTTALRTARTGLRRYGAALTASVLILSVPTTSTADLTWPKDQLLPSFPSPETTQDLIILGAGSATSDDELVLFASLKGIVNATRPRIFSYEGDAFAEGKDAWLKSFGLAWTEQTDKWALLTKYRSEIKGLVVYDTAQPDTMNLATTIAGREKALVAAPSLLPRLLASPYGFAIIKDLRGQFASKLAVYQSLSSDLWPSLTHRVVIGLSPAFHKASLREYAVATGAAVIWLDPNVTGESELLDVFLSSMGPGTVYMGWWPEEGPGVERASRHGIATVASDYATNLTLHGGMPRTVHVKPIGPKPILQNKLYVAFILSDGDNLQYVEHLMRKLWNDAGRGQVPMGWTVSPAMLDAMPGALDFYYTTGTNNDALISGPSGWGYGYPNYWPNQSLLDQFVAKSDDYAKRAGLRVVTVWNTITGGINANVGSSFAAHAPSLLGLTAQNTGGGLTVYDGKLPGFALSCNYCTNEQAIKDHIGSAASGWDRSSPRFILIQAQPWQGVTPTTFRNVQNSLNADYVVVRPDNWFQLLRQTQGFPVEPIAPIADGVYRIVNRASGKCVAVDAASSAVVQRECADDDGQRWRVTATDRGYVTIARLADTTQIVSVAGGSSGTGDGPKVVVSGNLAAASQQWQPAWESEIYYHLFARHSDRCLDVPSGSSDENLQLDQWTCTGTSAQAFQFADPVWTPPAGPDAGTPGPDAGAPTPQDGGSPSSDASTPSLDAGSPSVDAGSPSVDAGSPSMDAGSPTVDAGSPRADAGSPGGDAQAPGQPPDDVGSQDTVRGCSSCSTTGAHADRAGAFIALGLSLLLGRRRRQRRR
jgi:MYXO-CTERM domain-containing protein